MKAIVTEENRIAIVINERSEWSNTGWQDVEHMLSSESAIKIHNELGAAIQKVMGGQPKHQAREAPLGNLARRILYGEYDIEDERELLRRCEEVDKRREAEEKKC